MTKKEVQKLRHGIYRIYWKSGGSSLASVGSLHNGDRWFACCNWTSKNINGILVSYPHWRKVKRADLCEPSQQIIGCN